MAPSDFYLFPKLKSHLRGTQYGSNEGVIEAVNKEKAFYFHEPKQRWAKGVDLKGDYIEKISGTMVLLDSCCSFSIYNLY